MTAPRWHRPEYRCKCGNPIRILGRWCISCAEKEADRLVSVHARQRDGACQWPGCRVRGAARLDAHHVMRRSYHRVRFNPDNLISLCREHHGYFHRNKREFRAFIEDVAPGRWEHLLEQRERAGRVDLAAVISVFGRAA